MTGTVLVAGATGVVGAAAVEHFAAQAGWTVLGLSRRPPSRTVPGVTHLSVDLVDPASCRSVRRELAGVTHLFYAALYEKPDLLAGWRDAEQMQVNRAMLENLLDVLQADSGLRHVTLLQGTKAYGSHLGPVRVPLKERWPRHDHPNFYWLQEDLLRERQARADWHFSILRPQLVLGHCTGAPMNAIAALGAYAAIRREQGLPLAYPGGGRTVNAATDSRLIAAAAHFCGTHPVARNETYNVINGDVLVWQDLWPSVAAFFGMETGPDEPMRLAQTMPAHEPTWQRLVARHGLQSQSLASLVGSSWQFLDRSIAAGVTDPTPAVMSAVKLWQAGFHRWMDTEDAILQWLKRLQDERLLPR